MHPVKVFVTDTLPQEARAVLGDFTVFESGAPQSDVAQCDALMTWPSRVKPELVRTMKSLKMIQSMAAGVDALDFSAVPAGVRVFSNAGAFTEPVAEHAWGILLGVAKGVHVRNARTVPRSLRRKTLLVIGCGAIGTEVARLSRSLQMSTIGVSRSFKDPTVFDERYSVEELSLVVSKADAIAIALPLTSKTRGMIGHELLARTKEHVVIVNVGRGETVSEEGLIGWLKERPESRYVTDVFWKRDGKEVFDTPAWELQNFAGTNHISGVPLGEGTVRPMVAAAANVRAFFTTGKAQNEIDIGEYLVASPA